MQGNTSSRKETTVNVITRGIRNAFRNGTRTLSIVIILGLSIGLSLTMLIAHQAVTDKITSVKSSIGNTVTISPAGFRGMQGGGNPLTNDQINGISSLAHVTHVDKSITDRLRTSTNTSLQSGIDAGSLGQRFGDKSQGSVMFGTRDNADGTPGTVEIPITALGTNDPASLDGTALKLTSGTQIDGSKDTATALIGKSLADKNNLKVGSTFTAYDTAITVAGIFDTGTQFSNNEVIFSLPTLQRLSGQANNITSATVTVDSITNIDSVVSAVKNKIGSSNADVTSSKDTAQAALDPLESIKSVSLFSLIGAVVAGGAIILLTMVMIVRERRREIGVLKAIGGSNVRIMFQFMTEALTLTILGAVVGIFIGVIGGNPVTKTLVKNADSTTSTSAGVQPGGGLPRDGAPKPVAFDRGGGGGFGRRLGQNSAVKNVQNIQAEIGWSILGYGLGAAVLIALIGSACAAGLIAKVRPAQVMRTE